MIRKFNVTFLLTFKLDRWRYACIYPPLVLNILFNCMMLKGSCKDIELLYVMQRPL